MKNARRRSREFALQALYQWQINAISAAELHNQYASADGFAKADADLFVALMKGAIGAAENLAVQLTPHLDRPWVEVSPVERAIMLLAAFEMTAMPETPYRVIINEAIELAKSFGGTDGHKYVNGVLDKLAALVRADEIAYQAANPSAARAPRSSTGAASEAPTVTIKARKTRSPAPASSEKS
jgi:transcription antitermination protein NusB